MKKKENSNLPKDLSSSGPSFQLEWADSAEKHYFHLNEKERNRINRAVAEVLQNPFWGTQIKRLHGEFEDLFRYRVGRLRFIYRVISEKKVVRIIAFGPRGDIYKK